MAHGICARGKKWCVNKSTTGKLIWMSIDHVLTDTGRPLLLQNWAFHLFFSCIARIRRNYRSSSTSMQCTWISCEQNLFSQIIIYFFQSNNISPITIIVFSCHWLHGIEFLIRIRNEIRNSLIGCFVCGFRVRAAWPLNR